MLFPKNNGFPLLFVTEKKNIKIKEELKKSNIFLKQFLLSGKRVFFLKLETGNLNVFRLLRIDAVNLFLNYLFKVKRINKYSKILSKSLIITFRSILIF